MRKVGDAGGYISRPLAKINIAGRNRKTTSIPESRLCLLQDTAKPHGGDLPRETGGVIRLDSQRAQRRRPCRCLKFRSGKFAQKAVKRLLLVHTDNGIVIAGHSDIGYEGGAVRQDPLICCRGVRMRADNKTCAAIDEITHGLFFAGRFAVKIDDDGIGTSPERASRQFTLDGSKWIVER